MGGHNHFQITFLNLITTLNSSNSYICEGAFASSLLIFWLHFRIRTKTTTTLKLPVEILAKGP